MAGKKRYLLTAEDVKTWLLRRREIQSKIEALQSELESLNKKLSAAELVSPGSTNRKVQGAVNSATAKARALQEKEQIEDKGREENIGDALCADLQKSGASLNARDIRSRLIELGFGHKVKDRPNYVYGLLFRLAHAKRLQKRGEKYRAIPPASSGEEAGAKAPVLVVSNQ